MLIVQTIFLPLLFLAPLGEAKLRSQGWLGRLVAYHKRNFIEDLARLPLPITVEKAPADYVDHPGWNFEAVLRLVLLIEVLDVEPARQAVRFAMAPSRRHYLPFGVDTYQLFPSWSEFSVVNENDDTMNYAGVDAKYGPQPFDDDTVVYIDNALEARLPSKRITIKKMREVMEREALQRRNMVTTSTASTFSFTHASSTQKAAPGSSSESSSNNTQDAGSTNGTDDSSTAAPSSADPNAAGAETTEPAAGAEAADANAAGTETADANAAGTEAADANAAGTETADANAAEAETSEPAAETEATEAEAGS